jgi:hypothetical protein
MPLLVRPDQAEVKNKGVAQRKNDLSKRRHLSMLEVVD